MIFLEHAFHGNHILRLLLDVQMVSFQLDFLTSGFVAIFDLSDDTDDCKSSCGESDMQTTSPASILPPQILTSLVSYPWHLNILISSE